MREHNFAINFFYIKLETGAHICSDRHTKVGGNEKGRQNI